MTLDDGYLKLAVQRTACFSGDQHEVTLELRPDSAVVTTRIAGDSDSHKVPRVIGERFVIQVMDILNRPEKTRGDRCTLVHEAKVEWRLGQLAGAVEARSSDLGREQLEDLAGSARGDEAFREKMASALKDDTHNWAYELYTDARTLIDDLDVERGLGSQTGGSMDG